MLAQHAVLDTGQVAELMFGSRPAAVRHLRVLVNAGLASRFVFPNDPSHRANYKTSAEGIRHLAQRLRRSQLPVPATLGRVHADVAEVNAFLIGLTRTARATEGTAWLYGWRPGAEVVAWLHRLGISWVQPRAAGLWLQHGRAVRFLLHVDDDTPTLLLGTPAPPAAHALRGYRRAAAGIPATCLLMVCPSRTREDQLHHDLAADPLPVTVAATTRDLLTSSADPSGPIWSVAPAHLAGRIRLIDLAGA